MKPKYKIGELVGGPILGITESQEGEIYYKVRGVEGCIWEEDIESVDGEAIKSKWEVGDRIRKGRIVGVELQDGEIWYEVERVEVEHIRESELG